jgi:hypothetical protein
MTHAYLISIFDLAIHCCSLARLLGRDLRRPRGPLALLPSSLRSTQPAGPQSLKVATATKQPPGFVARLCSGPEATDVVVPGPPPRGPAPAPAPGSQEVEGGGRQGASNAPTSVSTALRLSLMGVSGSDGAGGGGAATDRATLGTPRPLASTPNAKRLLGQESLVSTEPDSVWLDVDASGAATPSGLLTTRTSDAPSPAAGLPGGGESAGPHGVPASPRPSPAPHQSRTPERALQQGTLQVQLPVVMSAEVRDSAQGGSSATGAGQAGVLVAAAPANSLLLQLQEQVAKGGVRGAEVWQQS